MVFGSCNQVQYSTYLYCYVAAFLDIIQMKNHFRISFFVRRNLIHFLLHTWNKKHASFWWHITSFLLKFYQYCDFLKYQQTPYSKILWSYHFVVLLTSYSVCVFQISSLIVCCYIHIFWSFIFLPIFIGWYLYLVKYKM